MQPFDLVLFRGADFVGKGLRLVQRLQLGADADYSHVGVVITREVCDDPRLLDGVFYLLESTCGGPLADGVRNINGESFLGVQIRCLSDVLQHCNGQAYHCAMKAEHRRRWYDKNMCNTYTTIIKQLEGIQYDANFISLTASLFPVLRCLRPTAEAAAHTQEWLFCSEMTALLLKKCELLPATVNERNVVPSDFVTSVADQDADLPKIFDPPVLFHPKPE